jgi:hypothetical protein
MLFDRPALKTNPVTGIRFKRYKAALRMAWRRISEEEIERAGSNGRELASLIEQRHGVSRDIALQHIYQMQQTHLSHSA